MPNVALTRTSAASQIRNALLEQIMSGSLPGGTRIKELHLARQFATSQGPVREAIRELETARLVISEPYRGTRVREVTEREMHEAYTVRAALEDLAARLAARSFRGNVVDLRDRAAGVRLAAEAGNQALFAARDLDFHRTILMRAGNDVLLRCWNGLEFELRLPMTLARKNVDLCQAEEAHWRIVDALNEGKGEEAGLLLQRHINHYFPGALEDPEGSINGVSNASAG